MRFRRCRIGGVKRRYKFCKDHDTVIIYIFGGGRLSSPFFSAYGGRTIPQSACGSQLPLHKGAKQRASPYGKGRCRAKRDGGDKTEGIRINGGDKRDKNLADGSSARYFREKGEKIFLSGTGGRKKLFRTFKKAGGGVHINCKSGAASQRCGALQRKTGNKE